MNFIKKHIFRSIGAMSLCIAAVSCTNDWLHIKTEGDFVSGENPLEFTATVEGMETRATDTDSWANNDTIRVRIGTYPWTGQYTLNTNGTVKNAVDALAWPHQEDSVSAWFPFLDNDTKVSIGDQSKGYHSYNFMSAGTNGIVSYKEIINLNFKHKMAKVSCELLKGDGVTEEDLKTAKITYFGFSSVTFTEEKLTPADEDWITYSQLATAKLAI